MSLFSIAFLKYAGERALKTFFQTLVGLIGVVSLSPEQAGIHELEWIHILSVAALATLVSIATSVTSVGVAKQPENAVLDTSANKLVETPHSPQAERTDSVRETEIS